MARGKKYTGREICRILGIAYPAFQQYVHYWNVKPCGIADDGRTRLFDERAIAFIQARRRIWPARDSKYKTWFKCSEVMPEIDKEYSVVIGVPVSKLCVIREYNKQHNVRFNFLSNKWINQDTNYPVTATIWKYAEIKETKENIQA